MSQINFKLKKKNHIFGLFKVGITEAPKPFNIKCFMVVVLVVHVCVCMRDNTTKIVKTFSSIILKYFNNWTCSSPEDINDHIHTFYYFICKSLCICKV